MLTRKDLPCPHNLSTVEWLDSTCEKLREEMNREDCPMETFLLDIYDDVCNALEVLIGPEELARLCRESKARCGAK